MKFKHIEEGYDKVAEYWHARRISGKNFYNEYLEMPTTLKLLGSIKGKKVLDLGCGTGVYAEILSKNGAKVKGIDISEQEIIIARRLNPKLEFKVGNAEKLPYKNNEFDIVLASLVMEHFKDWSKILKEVFRVLSKKGVFIFSMGNTVMNCLKENIKEGLQIRKSYFAEFKGFTNWWGYSKTEWYHKPFGTVIRLLKKNGFELEDYEDAKPLAKARRLFPKEYALTSRLPYFCTLKWRKNES